MENRSLKIIIFMVFKKKHDDRGWLRKILFKMETNVAISFTQTAEQKNWIIYVRQ